MGVVEGKVVVITGAGRGLGWGVARGFAREGATVALVDRTDDELELALEQTRAMGGQAQAWRADVTDPASVRAMIDGVVATFGRIDTLINNAAVLIEKPLEELTLQDWDLTLGVNLRGVFLCTQAVYRHLKAGGGGHIINISSGASRRGWVGETAYCASKWGLTGFTQSLALEGAPHRIAANEMGPGVLIKPTSIALADVENVPADVRAKWRDPIVMAEGFIWLSRQDPARVTGRRFNSFEVAERVRAEGWDVQIEGHNPTSDR